MNGLVLPRRRFIVGGLCVLAQGALARAEVAPAGRSITFRNTHTGEELTAAYFSSDAYDPQALARIDHVLRDHRSGEIGHMDPPLFDYLHEVARRAGVEPRFEVISGFRSATSNELLRRSGGGGVAQKSLHLKGKAIDVRLLGVETARVRDLALQIGRGGVGYYPKSDFVHIDTGRVRSWSGK
ncbi:MAG TPA: DUF882 domain-containing protein [Steroidobacteraceae bacterium]|nr:DUF882 domain-containing protein [Steroidobacteraceae bacterium]